MIDFEVYYSGTAIAITRDFAKPMMDEIVLNLIRKTGVHADWYYSGGRGVIKVIGSTWLARNFLATYYSQYIGNQIYLVKD